jgi:hypothetical protein
MREAPGADTRRPRARYVRIWHETDEPTAPHYVSYQRQIGKHLLAASISPSDPERTSGREGSGASSILSQLSSPPTREGSRMTPPSAPALRLLIGAIRCDGENSLLL